MPAGRRSRPISRPMTGVIHHQPASSASQLMATLTTEIRTTRANFFIPIPLSTQPPDHAASLLSRHCAINLRVVLTAPPARDLILVARPGRPLALAAPIGHLGPRSG